MEKKKEWGIVMRLMVFPLVPYGYVTIKYYYYCDHHW